MDKLSNEVNNANDISKVDRAEYTIFDYLKEHPGVLISSVSAMVVVITFVINLVIYVRTSKYLTYWGIDASYVQMDNTNQIYIFAVVCIYYITTIFILPFLMNSYDMYIKEMKVNYYAKYICKFCKKELGYCRRQLRRQKRVYKKLIGQDNEKEEIISIGKQIEALKEKISDAEKVRKKSSKLTINKLLVSTIIVSFVFVIQMYIVVLVVTDFTSIYKMILISIVGAVILLGFLFVLMYFLLTWPEVKLIKKEVYNSEEDFEKVTEYIKTLNPVYPIDKIFDLRIQEVLKNRVIITFLMYVICCLVCVMVFVAPLDETKMQEIREFSVVNDEGKEYVIIYNNSNFYYFVEASIEGENITIDTTKQRIIPVDNICYEKMKFEEVHRLTVGD